MRVRAVNAPGVIELWPEWGPSSAYEKFFNPKQVTSVGMTLKPNADGSLPSVEVYSFHTCGEENKDTAVSVRKEPMRCVCGTFILSISIKPSIHPAHDTTPHV